MPIYQFNCEPCRKELDVYRPMAQSGEPYACPNCGSQATRVYTFARTKEFAEYYHNGRRIGTAKQDRKYLKANGRVLTQETNGWKDIQRMAKDGQRRTKLAQKGHY